MDTLESLMCLVLVLSIIVIWNPWLSVRLDQETFTSFQLPQHSQGALSPFVDETVSQSSACPDYPVFSSTPMKSDGRSSNQVFPQSEVFVQRNSSGLQCPLCRIDPQQMLFVKKYNEHSPYVVPPKSEHILHLPGGDVEISSIYGPPGI